MGIVVWTRGAVSKVIALGSIEKAWENKQWEMDCPLVMGPKLQALSEAELAPLWTGLGAAVPSKRAGPALAERTWLQIARNQR